MKDKCKTCGKRTKYMYGLNDGVYCEKHLSVGLVNQKLELDRERLRDFIKNLCLR